jgi:hypothetical protein
MIVFTINLLNNLHHFCLFCSSTFFINITNLYFYFIIILLLFYYYFIVYIHITVQQLSLYFTLKYKL